MRFFSSYLNRVNSSIASLIFKNLIITVFAIILVGCSKGAGQPTQFYQLPLGQSVIADTAPTTATNILWVDNIQLAQQLSNVNIAFQVSDVNYTLAQNHFWASALDQQLQFALVDELTRLLPKTWVTTSPQSQNAYRLSVTVTQFHPRYDGKVVLGGRFSLIRNGQVVSQPFELTATQNKDGYDESVRQLAQLWKQQALLISKLIK